MYIYILFGNATLFGTVTYPGRLYLFVIQIVHPFAIFAGRYVRIHKLRVPQDRAPIYESEFRFVLFSFFWVSIATLPEYALKFFITFLIFVVCSWPARPADPDVLFGFRGYFPL